MAQKSQIIHVQFEGLRPVMFDRYAGDNNTQLPTGARMYLNDHDQLIIPALNLYSLLAAENTKSVCRQFFGKSGKNIALGISSYTTIDPLEIVLHDDTGPIVFTGEWTEQIRIHNAVARLKTGIPNPKTRPLVALPWHIDFTVEYVENRHCTLENLRQAFDWGGTLGLGTFRPYFGRYELTRWAVDGKERGDRADVALAVAMQDGALSERR
jgi:hypothetical protein